MADDIPTSVDAGAPLLVPEPKSTVRLATNSKGEPVYEVKLRIGDDEDEVREMFRLCVELFQDLQQKFPRFPLTGPTL